MREDFTCSSAGAPGLNAKPRLHHEKGGRESGMLTLEGANPLTSRIRPLAVRYWCLNMPYFLT